MNYIKEFWEWSKNIYGKAKSDRENISSLVNYNQQNGYSEEGQWALTQNGVVFIDKIEDGIYSGFDKKGNPKSGNINDIIRTLLKREIILKESISVRDLEIIGEGTEGIVYTDGKYAYKVSSLSLQGTPDEILERYIDHPNIIKVYDAFYLPEDTDYVVIKMELLDRIEDQIDLNDKETKDEFNRIQSILWNVCDLHDKDGAKELMRLKSNNKEIQKMIEAIQEAYKAVGHLDVGFNNLMYDKNTGKYKQIDI